eukprot:TRINITY_DN65817_c0_g1_i1.p1 TRINITY_DN65817_c0_g1~~TRINITY_DN65817_c0_g1_i1.p1  ORF type:complete len:265 (+),score=76.56 TRINITY_DN65817_c0_g1_i1:99-893(+)
MASAGIADAAGAALAAEAVKRWQGQFQEFTKTLQQCQADLQRWELLGDGQASKPQERAKIGATVRAKANQLANDQGRLSSELEAIGAQKAAAEVTKKQVAQLRDNLIAAKQQLSDVQQRLRRQTSFKNSDAPHLAGSANGSARSLQEAEMPSMASMPAARAMSNRELISQQKSAMRDLEQPLNALEERVDGLRHVSGMINTEIVYQNRMLDDTNQAADRAQSRLSRVSRLMQRMHGTDNVKCLGFTLVVLLAILITLCIWVLMN